MKKFILTEEEKNEIRGLYESVVKTAPEDNEWCKTNITDNSNQICVIKTPSATADKNVCQTMTGRMARQEGYVNLIKMDVSEPNFCKTVWGKIK